MRMVAGIVTTLVVAQGCASTSPDNIPEASSDAELGKLSAALSGSCSDRVDELKDFAFWASNEANEARVKYDNDPYGPLARRFFGVDYDPDLVGARLLRLVQIARSPSLSFECLSASDASCADPTTALWTWDGEWHKDSGWTIRVCGDRFWDQEYVDGVDSDHEASQVGIMVHEIAHLTGAISDFATLDEDALVKAALNPANNTADWAESYRYYVMKTR